MTLVYLDSSLPRLLSGEIRVREVETLVEQAGPEICRFLGIVITMFYNDHSPPHFHARYGGQRALVAIDTLVVLEGRLSPRVLGLVTEWAALHQEELREDWRLARQQAPMRAIAPLE